MSKSRTWLVLVAVGTLLMSFLGVMAGNYYLEWRRSRSGEQSSSQAERPIEVNLHPGDRFPDVPIVSVDGMSTGTLPFARDRDAIYVFLALDCEPCVAAIQEWNRFELPQTAPRLIGICDDDLETARNYAREAALRFPLLCDTGAVFHREYAMDVFPTVVGVRRGGQIAYVRHGLDDFSIDDAIARLRNTPN